MKNILLYLLVSFSICVAGMAVSDDVYAKKSHKSEKSNKSHKSEKSNKSEKSKKSKKSKKSQKPVPKPKFLICHFPETEQARVIEVSLRALQRHFDNHGDRDYNPMAGLNCDPIRTQPQE